MFNNNIVTTFFVSFIVGILMKSLWTKKGFNQTNLTWLTFITIFNDTKTFLATLKIAHLVGEIMLSALTPH
jgi:hypothetical protein